MAENNSEVRREEGEERASGEQARLALEAGRMGVWSLDLEVGRTTWSPRLERMHGLGEGAFGGGIQDFLCVVHPDDRASVVSATEESIASGREFRREYRAVWPDGAVRWIESRGVPFLSSTPPRLVGISHDITERKGLENLLHEEARRLAALSRAQNEIAMATGDLAQISQNIVDRLLEITGAEGAAILSIVPPIEKEAASTAGTPSTSVEPERSLIFTSGAGLCASHLGARIPFEKSLVGRSVREKRVLRCDDVEVLDERSGPVDAASCRRVGARSLVAASLEHEGSAPWALLLISPRPRAFCERDEQALDLLRSLCAAVLSRAMEAQEKQEALGALEQSEKKFKSAFEMSSLGMALIGLDGRWLQANRSLCVMLGYSEDELRGTTFQALTFPGDMDDSLKPRERALRGEITSYQVTKRYIHRDGHVVWGELNVSLVRDASGAALHFVSQIQDISQSKRSQDALRASEAMKRAVIETSLDCLVTMDHEGRIVEWNAAAEATFDWSREQVLGRNLHEMIVPPELREAHRAGLAKYLVTGEGPVLGRRLEMPAVRAGGERLVIELSIVAIPGMEPPIFTGHLRDITERKRNEDALRESEARYGRIAANVPGMVYQFVLRPDGSTSFPFVSHGCRDIYRLEPAQIQADPTLVTGIVHPEDAESFSSSIATSAQSLLPWAWEGRIVLPGGQEKWLQGAARPMREGNGDILWDGLLIDVTGRKLAEAHILAAREEAERARGEAERANAAKSEFLSRMSHELRTPLNAILGFGQLLEMSRLKPMESESAGQIVKAGRHLLGLINEVLDLARIESGKISLSLEPVEVGLLFGEAISLVRPLAEQRSISMEISGVPEAGTPEAGVPEAGAPEAGEAGMEEGFFVQADRQRLQQVLLNLLSNAIKYNREGGSVTLSLQKGAQGRARLCVRDTGPGIEPSKMNRLWAPFDRLDAEKGETEGTGIGLVLSRRLAEAMGGRLEVTSTWGQRQEQDKEHAEESGSTFWIEMPRAASPMAGQEAAAQWSVDFSGDEGAQGVERTAGGEGGEGAPNAPKKTVLYIEDNLSNLALLRRILARHGGIEMVSAMHGGLGLDLARQIQPDLILLDLHLPEIPGDEVLRRLLECEETKDIPVVILSADATPGRIERLLASGARAYLTKPFQIPRLVAVLEQHLFQTAPQTSHPTSATD